MPTPSFPDVISRITAAISALGGEGVIPKLNWSAPRVSSHGDDLSFSQEELKFFSLVGCSMDQHHQQSVLLLPCGGDSAAQEL